MAITRCFIPASAASSPTLPFPSLLCRLSLSRLGQFSVFKTTHGRACSASSSSPPVLARVIAQGGAGYGIFPSGRRRFGEVDLAGNSWNAFQWPREKVVQWRGQSVRCMCVSSAPRKEVAVEVAVVVDESTAVGISLQAEIEQLEVDGPLAVRLAIEGLEDLEKSETVELDVMLCNDACIQGLNKQWRDKDAPTDVLSFPQDQPPGETPTLLLGDVVISVETAARQAKERGHTLIDELRILLVHGLLHVLDYDHELGPSASKEMEEEENRILNSLGWKGKGLISAATIEDGLSFKDIKTSNSNLSVSVESEPLRRVLTELFKVRMSSAPFTILQKSRVIGDMDDEDLEDVDDETSEDQGDSSLVALGQSVFPETLDETVPTSEKNTKHGGKLRLGRAAPPNRTSTHLSLVAEGHTIVPSTVQGNISPFRGEEAYTLRGRIQDMVGSDPAGGATEETELSDVDDELTNRAIRACLAAEAVMAALREECNFFQPNVSSDKSISKQGHARRGCKCPGKGATCNATLSLQLQLAACENLSLAATAAFRELVAARLGVPMPAPSRDNSPRKQRKKKKKPKKEKKSPPPEPPPPVPRLSMMSIKRGSTFGKSGPDKNGEGSAFEEKPPQGPFSCSHPPILVAAGAPPEPLPSSCDHPSLKVAPPPPSHSCFADSILGSGGSLKTKFKILFCDMDGTLLNSRSMITPKTADALRAAMKMGVQVIIATGKTRPAALAALETVGLAGGGGALSLSTPGVFVQGLQVYGKGGAMIHSETLDPSVVTETFKFSVEHQTPLVGFSGDRCVTLFTHTLIDELHEVYYEPKAEVLECIDQVNKAKVQKVLFIDTAERVANFLRPHWSLAAKGRATVVQALPEMMELLPVGASKGAGVQLLLDHLNVPLDQVMAIGDGENDIEMLAMAGWGVAMANGTARTKGVAKAVTSSNDEDGVAKAIQDYILSGLF